MKLPISWMNAYRNFVVKVQTDDTVCFYCNNTKILNGKPCPHCNNQPGENQNASDQKSGNKQ